jgi:polygalacturonase
MINLYNCTNVLIRDLPLLNSPSWNVHPVYCENVTIDNLTIIAPSDSPNTDAVDPDSCRNVRISNGFFDVGDDCIVIKSGYNEDGRRVGIPCENILVSNCTFGHGHGGVVIGSEMSGSVRNVTVANCVFDGTQRGLRVKTSLGRGGVIENFRASNLVMRNITDAAFSVTAAYDREAKASTEKAAPETIPVMRRIHWSDIIVTGVNKIADISSLQESPLEDFSLRNIQVTSAKTGIRCSNAKGVVLDGLNLEVGSGAAVEAQNVVGLDLLRLEVPKASGGAPVVSFKAVSPALVRECKVSAGAGVFLHSDNVTNEVTCESNRLAPGMKERGP